MASLLPTPEPPDPVEGALGHFEHSNWVKQALKNLDAGTVHAAGGTGGALTFEELIINNSSDETANLSLVGNGFRTIRGKSAAGTNRWQLTLGDATVEGGSNSGSRFSLLAYQDDGVSARTVLAADRASGLVTVGGPPVVNEGIATKAYVDNAMPIGAIIAYGGAAAPPGWHLCDGSVHGSSALQGVLGTTTTPNLVDRFIVGAGNAYAPKATGGAATVQLTAAESGVPAHGHAASSGVTSINHAHSASTGAAGTHSHGGWTGAMDRAAAHHHTAGWMEGSFTSGGDDGDVIDSTGPSQGYVRWSLYVQDTNTNHLHSISADGNHAHSVSVAAADVPHSHTVAVSANAAAGAAAAHENRPPYYALVYIIKKA